MWASQNHYHAITICEAITDEKKPQQWVGESEKIHAGNLDQIIRTKLPVINTTIISDDIFENIASK